MNHVCKECGKEFKERGLHGHIMKTHDITVPAYYEKHFPRFDLLTKEALPYQDYTAYFDAEFVSAENERKWLKSVEKEKAKEYLLRRLQKRMEMKKLTYAPSFVEFETSELPPYKAYVYFFGSFENACSEIKVQPLLYDRKSVEPITVGKPTILIDSREQRPLIFPNSREQKLTIGDYTLAGDDYTYTYVDRKSEGDFKNTITQQQERFLREIERAATLDSYIYVVVEESIKGLEQNNGVTCHKTNMKYVWSSMRKIQHVHPRRVQFVFTGSRENSQRIIPYLLTYGNKLWNVDVQYLLSVKGAV